MQTSDVSKEQQLALNEGQVSPLRAPQQKLWFGTELVLDGEQNYSTSHAPLSPPSSLPPPALANQSPAVLRQNKLTNFCPPPGREPSIFPMPDLRHFHHRILSFVCNEVLNNWGKHFFLPRKNLGAYLLLDATRAWTHPLVSPVPSRLSYHCSLFIQTR